jgi:hypothetical protein
MPLAGLEPTNPARERQRTRPTPYTAPPLVLGGEELVEQISALPHAFMACTETITNISFCTASDVLDRWAGENEAAHATRWR